MVGEPISCLWASVRMHTLTQLINQSELRGTFKLTNQIPTSSMPNLHMDGTKNRKQPPPQKKTRLVARILQRKCSNPECYLAIHFQVPFLLQGASH